MKINITKEGIFINETNWKDISVGKKVLYAGLIPFLTIIAIVVSILAITLALGAVALVIPFVLIIVTFVIAIVIIILVIVLPIALITKGKNFKNTIIIEEDKKEDMK
jgi:hypothetical protein